MSAISTILPLLALSAVAFAFMRHPPAYAIDINSKNANFSGDLNVMVTAGGEFAAVFCGGGDKFKLSSGVFVCAD